MQVAVALGELDAVFASAGEAAVGRTGSSPRARSRRAPAPAASTPMQPATSVGPPRSRPANWYSDSESGTGVTAPSIVAGSAPSATAIGNGRPGSARACSRKSSAPPRCASQRMITWSPRDHLLPIDAEVLPRARPRDALRSPRHDESPRDQRPGIVGPAGLDRQRAEVDVAALDDMTLTRGATDDARRHVAQRLHHRDQPAGVLEAARRLRFLQRRQQRPDVAQRGDRVLAHAGRDALDGPEQVREQRHRRAGGMLEQQRRSGGAQRAVADLGHFEARRHRRRNALRKAASLQLRDEIAQVLVSNAHRRGIGGGPAGRRSRRSGHHRPVNISLIDRPRRAAYLARSTSIDGPTRPRSRPRSIAQAHVARAAAEPVAASRERATRRPQAGSPDAHVFNKRACLVRFDCCDGSGRIPAAPGRP